jgi:hypothetical protein
MIGGLPPISSSWRQAPWDSRPAFFFNWIIAFLVLTSFKTAAGPRQRSHSQVRVLNSRLPQPVSVFIFPRKRVAQLYPQALGSLFIASYDSQRYGGGIGTHLHTGFCILEMALWWRYWNPPPHGILHPRDGKSHFMSSPYTSNRHVWYFQKCERNMALFIFRRPPTKLPTWVWVSDGSEY